MAIANSPAANPLALLRQLEWRVRHAVENILSGEYRSAFRGRGIEFDQVVRYEFGDDVRDIDWNVTARLGRALPQEVRRGARGDAPPRPRGFADAQLRLGSRSPSGRRCSSSRASSCSSAP